MTVWQCLAMCAVAFGVLMCSLYVIFKVTKE